MPHLKLCVRPKIVAKLLECEANALPDFVAEASIAVDAEHIEVHVAAVRRVAEESKAKGIDAALRYSLRIIFLLAGFCGF